MKYKNYLSKITPEDKSIEADTKVAYLEEFYNEIKAVKYLTKRVSGKTIEPIECLNVIAEEATYNQNLDVNLPCKYYFEKNSDIRITYREILDHYNSKSLAIKERILVISTIIFIAFALFVYSLTN